MTDSTMPKRDTGVHKRKDSELWQWQIKAPKDLQALYTSVWAHRCSLGTADLAQANRRAAALRAQWLETFESQRKQLNPTRISALTPELARFIASKGINDTLLSDQKLRIDPRAQEPWLRYLAEIKDIDPVPMSNALEGMPDQLADYLFDLNSRHAEATAKALARGKLLSALPGMQHVAASCGILFDADTPGAQEGLLIYLEAMREATSALVQRDQGEIVPVPPAPHLTLTRADSTPAHTLRDVLRRWKAGKQPGTDSVRRAEQMVELFERQTGNPPILSVTRDHGEGMRAHLLSLPLASKTKHDRFTTLKSLFNYASNDLGWLPKSPWTGLDIKHRTENKRAPWSAAQLTAFFGHPLFQKYDLPVNAWRAGGDAAYWIPVLALYTGARIGELCQLETNDVDIDSDTPCINIHAKAEGSKVKTEAGIRSIPVHSELIRLGFFEYVRAVKNRGIGRLWPNLKTRSGKPSGHFSNWFGEFRKQVPVAVPDFHSFRHTVRSKLTEAGVLEAIQDRITGHETVGSVGTTVYTHHSLASLKMGIEKITYPELALPKVYGMG